LAVLALTSAVAVPRDRAVMLRSANWSVCHPSMPGPKPARNGVAPHIGFEVDMCACCLTRPALGFSPHHGRCRIIRT